MSVLDRVDTKQRMFIGLPVPEPVQERLTEAAQEHYSQYFKSLTPSEQWHVTLFFFGDVLNPEQYLSRVKQNLPQAFVPTVSITHIGRGGARDQLWAYATPTPALLNLREAVNERLLKMRFPRPINRRQFVPHVGLATFFPLVAGMGLADTPVHISYAVREVHLYSSVISNAGPTYTIEATIKL